MEMVLLPSLESYVLIGVGLSVGWLVGWLVCLLVGCLLFGWVGWLVFLVCWFVCLSVSNITQNVMDGF